MTFKLLLDGTEYTPFEWANTEFVREWEEDIFEYKMDTQYTFDGEAYKYIKSVFDGGFCDVVETKIYIDGSLEFVGNIFVSDCEFDLIKCTVSCPVSDANLATFIRTKQRQRYLLDAGVSNFGISVSPATETLFEFHDVDTGSALPDLRRGFYVYDVLEYLIRVMSNDEMGLQSDYLTVGEGKGLAIFTGKELRNPSANNIVPELSWDEVYEAVKTLKNLAIDVIEDGGQYVVKIENYEYFKQASPTKRLDPIEELVTRLDSDDLYSLIKIGSDQTRDTVETFGPNNAFIDNIYLGWEDAQYNVRGDCVTENELDLTTSRFLIDSNNIERQVRYPDYYGTVTSTGSQQLIDSGASFGQTVGYKVTNLTTGATTTSIGTSTGTTIFLENSIFPSIGHSYAVEFTESNTDDECFIVETDAAEYPSIPSTTSCDLQGTGAYLYNCGINNASVLGRWAGRYHNTVFRYNKSDNDEFLAETTADVTVFTGCNPTPGDISFWGDPADVCGLGDRIEYDNEIFDNGNYFDAVTNFWYNVPFAGTYSFRVGFDVEINITELRGTFVTHRIITFLYDELSSQLYGTRILVIPDVRNAPGTNASQSFQFEHQFTFTGLANARIRPYVSFEILDDDGTSSFFQFGSSATFKSGCYFACDGSSLIFADPGSGVDVIEGDVDLCLSDWQAIKQGYNPIPYGPQAGYLQRLVYRPFGKSQLITKYIRNS